LWTHIRELDSLPTFAPFTSLGSDWSAQGDQAIHKRFSAEGTEKVRVDNGIAVDGTENYGCNYLDGRALPGAAFLSDMVSRIPDESRLATLTGAPNKERMR
jgi:hypothetical protein